MRMLCILEGTFCTLAPIGSDEWLLDISGVDDHWGLPKTNVSRQFWDRIWSEGRIKTFYDKKILTYKLDKTEFELME